MVYSRRRRFRRFRRRTRRPYRRTYNRRRFYRRASRIVNAVAEKKLNMFELNASGFSSVGTTWTELTWLPISGTTGPSKIGNKISITSIGFKGTLVGGQANLALDDNRNWVRIVLAFWKNPSTTGASLHTPLNLNSFPSGMSIDKTTQPTMLFKCCDKQILLTSPGRDSTGYIPPQRMVSYFHKFRKPVTITWDALTQIPDKQWFMSMVTDSTAAPSPGFVTGYLTVRWSDV